MAGNSDRVRETQRLQAQAQLPWQAVGNFETR